MLFCQKVVVGGFTVYFYLTSSTVEWFSLYNKRRELSKVRAFNIGVFRRGNKPPVLLGEDKKSSATIKSGEASAKPQRNIGKN